ncbi:JAB domain-containing protein [Rufibacter quisquiliarum]|uniref:DNA repair protein RadC n=1 Tax=Rufibacter quisquiliarum TaxID=1549639 RepID=A0A839GG49_9BACT|nr:JAB domain-containing protein [Rufibacter quisquiliarum]MBA9076563.1 DNA repair protein RadC [Rufibacter quisquiliarum]
MSLLYQLAEIELIYRSKVSPSSRPKITCSRDAYKVFLQAWDKNKLEFIEQAKIMLLNRAGHVLGLCNISTGGTAGTVVDPKQVFVAALKANASSILLAHNHPSCSLKPSAADIALTNKLKEAGRFLDIAVHDHLIVTKEGYYSFADELGL